MAWSRDDHTTRSLAHNIWIDLGAQTEIDHTGPEPLQLQQRCVEAIQLWLLKGALL